MVGMTSDAVFDVPQIWKRPPRMQDWGTPDNSYHKAWLQAHPSGWIVLDIWPEYLMSPRLSHWYHNISSWFAGIDAGRSYVPPCITKWVYCPIAGHVRQAHDACLALALLATILAFREHRSDKASMWAVGHSYSYVKNGLKLSHSGGFLDFVLTQFLNRSASIEIFP